MNTFHIIEATYMPPTEKKGARIKIRSSRFNETIFVSRHEFESGTDWCNKNDFNIVGTGFTDKAIIIVTDTFKPLKNEGKHK